MEKYNFHIKGEKGLYQIAFAIDSENIDSSCNCNYHKDGSQLCWHRHYILAGKTQRMPNAEEQISQKALIRILSQTEGGRNLIAEAKARFGEKETCRRCNQARVIKLDNSIAGNILSIFLPSGRKYFCKSCYWSW